MSVHNIVIDARGIWSMVQNDKDNVNGEEKAAGFSIYINAQTVKKLLSSYIVPVVLSIIASFIYDNSRLGGIEDTLSEINVRLTAIENNNLNSNDININISGLIPTDEGKIDVKYSDYLVASTDNDKIYIIDSPSNNEEKMSISISDVTMCSIDPPSWQLSDEIAIDVENDITYTAEKLVNQKILLPYKIENQECYFYGQFNEKNQWNGNCIINIYENDSLVLIMEAEYDNGNLLAYKQVFQSEKSEYAVWSFSDRTSEVNYTSGRTWNYFKTDNYIKDFEFNNVTSEDIFDVKKFEAIIKGNGLEEYYYGRTSDGFFNDDSGNAYLAKYSNDGTLRMLYVGNFKDGMPEDNTGKAWEIVFDSSNKINKYFYFKGVFKNSKRQGKVTSRNYVTQEQINEIIKDMIFDCELNWYDENSNDVGKEVAIL